MPPNPVDHLLSVAADEVEDGLTDKTTQEMVEKLLEEGQAPSVLRLLPQLRPHAEVVVCIRRHEL